MKTVDLWDYLLQEKVLGGMQGLRRRGGWSGGSCGVVSGHDDKEKQETSARCSYPTCMYMYIHVHSILAKKDQKEEKETPPTHTPNTNRQNTHMHTQKEQDQPDVHVHTCTW